MDGKKLEPESNVLLASIENMQYAVTLDVLHMVFSSFGPVQKIAMFDKNGGLQALIQYPVRQEDSIIFYLLERAQYCYNVDTYEPNAFSMDGFHGSLVEYLLKETGKLHAKV
ncbi:hypothetical protein K1719_024228 [Acacia pycnantha]|nr:hypothetical protein K1719_024228 [Acacia pycnantha]